MCVCVYVCVSDPPPSNRVYKGLMILFLHEILE